MAVYCQVYDYITCRLMGSALVSALVLSVGPPLPFNLSGDYAEILEYYIHSHANVMAIFLENLD